MPEKKEKPIVIELYELWNNVKSRFNIVSPQPKSFTLDMVLHPVLPIEEQTTLLIDLTDTTTVTAGNSVVVTHTPPDGYVDSIVGLYLSAVAPAGAAAGDHFFYLANETDPLMIYTYAYSVFGTAIKWTFSQWHTKTGSAPNATYIDVLAVLSRIPITTTHPIRFTYENQTDVSQAAARAILVLVKRKLVGDV